MILWFYLLWSITVVRVLFSPFFKVVGKGMWLGCIALGVWLLIGALFYQSQYASYLLHRTEYEEKRMQFQEKKEKLETLYQKHPTSRDVLLELGSMAHILGEREQLLDYTQTLRQVDPNNDRVKGFLNSLL